MIKDFDKKLDKYAEVVVKIGVSIQEGQSLLISAPIETAEFTRKVVKHAYNSGAKRVIVEWNDSQTSRLHIEKASEETLKEIPQWEIDKLKHLAENEQNVPLDMLTEG